MADRTAVRRAALSIRPARSSAKSGITGAGGSRPRAAWCRRDARAAFLVTFTAMPSSQGRSDPPACWTVPRSRHASKNVSDTTSSAADQFPVHPAADACDAGGHAGGELTHCRRANRGEELVAVGEVPVDGVGHNAYHPRRFTEHDRVRTPSSGQLEPCGDQAVADGDAPV